MKKAFLIAILVSLIIGIIAFLASNNYFVAAGITIVYIIYYFVFAHRKLLKYSKKVDRIHYCYHFINSVLITMSVRDSLEESYRSGVQGSRGDLKHIANEIENMEINERIHYLRKYFNLSIYKMFLNVLEIYIDQGGNILDMADSLINESTRIEDSLNKTVRSVYKNLIEFVILWVLSLGVLLFMRFGISSFYLQMLHSPIFIGVLVVFFIVILFSIHMMIERTTELFIKEDNV